MNGLTDALDYVARRYPYLVDDSGTLTRTEPTDSGRSGSPQNHRKFNPTALSEATLRSKFPALGDRRR